LVVAAEQPDSKFSRTISLPTDGKERLIALPFDRDLYANSAQTFADLRLTTVDGKPVPFLVQMKSTIQTRVEHRPWTSAPSKVDLKPLSDGGLEVRITLDEKQPQPDGLRIITPLKNFEQRVTVFGTPFGRPEQELVKETSLYDYSEYMDVSRTSIPLPKNQAREFRLVISAKSSERESPFKSLSRQIKGGEETSRIENTTVERRAFRIDRIEFWGDVEHRGMKEEAVKAWPIESFKQSTDKEKQQTLIEVKTGREPLTKFVLETSSRNFNRRVHVLVPEVHGVRTTWRELAQATVHRFEFEDIHEERLEVSIGESRHETYRLAIDNYDNPELDFTAIKTEGRDYRAICLSQGDQTLTLSYGDEKAAAPVYDTLAITTVLNRNIEPEVIELGAQSDAKSTPHNIKPRELLNNKMLLVSIVIILVVILGTALFRASQRLDLSKLNDDADHKTPTDES